MGFIIKQLIVKIAERGIKIDMTDVLNQQTASDIIHALRVVLEETIL